MNITIYAMTHKQFEVQSDPLYQPLHVGRACALDLGYPGDDTGENISHLAERLFCKTALQYPTK